MNKSLTYGFIGAGNMGEALVGGLVNSGLAEPSSIVVTDVLSSRLQHFRHSYNVRSEPNNVSAIQGADVVILCVKPQIMNVVLSEISTKISKRQILISVAAGYPIDQIQEFVGMEIPIIRAMPNTPAIIRHGVTALSGSPGIASEHLLLGQKIFESVGKVVTVEESLMDAVTGLSGSGPAYVYVMIEALTDGGVRVGLPRPIAQVLATHTVLGAARMVEETGDHPAILKDRVTSPGGTTIAGLRELEAGGLRSTVIKAVEAATNRSAELGKRSSVH